MISDLKFLKKLLKLRHLKKIDQKFKKIQCQKIVKISFKNNSNLKIAKIENKELLIHFLDDSFINMNNIKSRS